MKAGIQAKGQRKLSTYSRAELTMMANAMIGALVHRAGEGSGSLNETQDMSNGERPAVHGLLLNETHAQNGAVK